MTDRVRAYIENHINLLEHQPELFISDATSYLSYHETTELVHVLKYAGIDLQEYVLTYLHKHIVEELNAYKGERVLHFAADTPPFGISLKDIQELIIDIAMSHGFTINGPSGEEYLTK